MLIINRHCSASRFFRKKLFSTYLRAETMALAYRKNFYCHANLRLRSIKIYLSASATEESFAVFVDIFPQAYQNMLQRALLGSLGLGSSIDARIGNSNRYGLLSRFRSRTLSIGEPQFAQMQVSETHMGRSCYKALSLKTLEYRYEIENSRRS